LGDGLRYCGFHIPNQKAGVPVLRTRRSIPIGKYWDLVLSNLPTESSPLYPYTTNATHLNKGLVKILLQPDSKDKLTAILTYHVLPARVTAEEIVRLSSAKTLNGEPLQIKVNQGRVQVNQSSVISADILCSNGVIHVIDSVLIPE